MSTTVKAPPPRNIGNETKETLQAQISVRPEQLASEREFRPQFADLELSTLDRMLGGSDGQRGILELFQQDVVPSLSETDSASARARREADLRDVAELGQQAKDAVETLNPEQARLLRALNESAISQVEAGADLDPDLQRQVQQSVRSAQAARGMGFGLNDSAQEALFSGQVGEQLRQGRQSFGQQIAGLNQATGLDASLAILGRPGVNLHNASQLAGQANGLNPGPLFDPFNPYAADLFSSNQNAVAATNIANANARSGLLGGIFGMAGGLGGGFLAGR